MKEKIKKVIIVFTCSVMVFVSILAVLRYDFALKNYSRVDLVDSNDNLAKLAEYQKEVDKLKNSDCKKVINEYIDAYKATSFNGTYTRKQVGEAQNKVYVNMASAIKKCDFTKEQKRDAAYYILDISYFNSKPFYDHPKYTISITDYFIEFHTAPSLFGPEYSLQRQSYLRLIEHLIQVEKTRGDTNEK